MLSSRNFWDVGNVFNQQYSVWQPIAACDYRALEMRLIRLRNLI